MGHNDTSVWGLVQDKNCWDLRIEKFTKVPAVVVQH